MIKIMRYLEEDYFRYLNLTYSLNSIYACAILLFIVYVLYLTKVTPLTDRSTMHHEDQSLQKQKIHAEDVAYAAFLDTVLDVGEELEQYDECAALSGSKLQTTLDEIDVLKYSVDTAYKVLLDAALSPLSSRLSRCKSNLETRIEELKNHLRNTNAVHTPDEQKELCDTSEPDRQQDKNSSVIVEARDCYDDDIAQTGDDTVQSDDDTVQADDDTVQADDDTVQVDDDIVQTDDACVQSNRTDNDGLQICHKHFDLINDMIMVPDEDRQIEKDSVPGATGITTEDVLHTDLNMTKLMITECCAETDDITCECRSISGLKHRWRWKL